MLADASIVSFRLGARLAQVSAGSHLAVPGSHGTSADVDCPSQLACNVLLQLVCQDLLEIIPRAANGPCKDEGPIEAHLHLLATLLAVLAELGRRLQVFLEEYSTLLIDIISLRPAQLVHQVVVGIIVRARALISFRNKTVLQIESLQLLSWKLERAGLVHRNPTDSANVGFGLGHI